MADKFKNKYRTTSHRKPDWHYSSEALYYLTIVTQNRDCNLGEIVNSNGRIHMQLSDFGKIVEQEWLKSFEIRKELFLHQYVIMPNHIHTIAEIYHENRDDLYGKTQCLNIDVETHGRVSLAPNGTPNATNSDTSIELIDPQLLSIKRNPPKRLPKSISSFIAGFKSAVNTKIDDFIDEHQLGIPKYNRKNHFFQPNYHYHIVRNDWEYMNIANYIINNPNNWNRDIMNGKM